MYKPTHFLDALERLARFPPNTGRTYARRRNYDACTGLLTTEENPSLGWLFDQVIPSATATVKATRYLGPLAVARHGHQPRTVFRIQRQIRELIVALRGLTVC